MNESYAEYESLRREIERRSTTQQALIVLNLAGVVAVTTAVAKMHNRDTGALVLLVIAFASYALGRLWLDHHRAIKAIARYISEELEPRLQLGWESWTNKPRGSGLAAGFAIAHILIFCGPGVTAIVASWALAKDASRLAIASPLLLTAMLMALIGVEIAFEIGPERRLLQKWHTAGEGMRSERESASTSD
jgi:hypothetical protein